jgi:hypothetical protein
LWFRVEEIKMEQGLLQYLINHRKSQVQSQLLVEERIIHEVYNLGLCMNLHLQITMNRWKIGSWNKTPISMWLRRLSKIAYNHLNMQRHNQMCWMKYHNHTHIKEI